MKVHIHTAAAPSRACEACNMPLAVADVSSDSWTEWENSPERCAAPKPALSLMTREGVVAMLEEIKRGGNIADVRLWDTAMAALAELKK